jgi:hypothetical protein
MCRGCRNSGVSPRSCAARGGGASCCCARENEQGKKKGRRLEFSGRHPWGELLLGAGSSLRDGEDELGEGSRCSMLLGKKGVAVLCWPSSKEQGARAKRRTGRALGCLPWTAERGRKRWAPWEQLQRAEEEGRPAGFPWKEWGAMGRRVEESSCWAPAMERSRASAAMGGAPAGNPTHAARATTKGKGRLHQGTWPWRRAGRWRAPKELGHGCICWAPWKKNRGHGRHGCWWLPAAAGHGEKRVALGRGNELSAGRWSRGPARVLEPAQGRGGDAMDGQGGSQACCRGARRKKGSGGCIFLRGGSAKMPPLARRWLLFIERH